MKKKAFFIIFKGLFIEVNKTNSFGRKKSNGDINNRSNSSDDKHDNKDKNNNYNNIKNINSNMATTTLLSDYQNTNNKQ